MVVLPGGPIQKLNFFSSQAFVLAQSQGDSVAWPGGRLRTQVRTCVSSRLPHTMLWTLLSNDSRSTLSHLSPPPCLHTPLFSVFPISPSRVIIIVA
ncbi:rCG63682, partial [Rattus norvegicus]